MCSFFIKNGSEENIPKTKSAENIALFEQVKWSRNGVQTTIKSYNETDTFKNHWRSKPENVY